MGKSRIGVNMDNSKLFETDVVNGEITLTYSGDGGAMPAKDLGEAILGLESCLVELAKVSNLVYEEVYIYPISKGSVKTTVVYIKKHPWKVITGVGLVADLLVNSLTLMERFGSSSLKTPNAEIMAAASDPRVLEVCRNFNFRNGAERIARPLNEENTTATITITDNNFTIKCENKYKFYASGEEKILPELKNGDKVTLIGPITRINKKTNDLGFEYKGHTLSISPMDEEESAAKFHEYLDMDEVELTGIVDRNTDYELPRIKVIKISQILREQQNIFATDEENISNPNKESKKKGS